MIISIEGGKLVALEVSADITADDRIVETITSIEQFNDICERNGGSVLCSSSVDFPEEYTQDAAVIQLCREIRS